MMSITKEYRIFGLRRTGNHAIINWIIKQSGENCSFLNDHELNTSFPLNCTNEETYTFIHSYEEQLISPSNLRLNDFYLEQEGLIGNKRFDVIIIRDPFNFFASRLKSGYTTTWRTPRLNQVDLWILFAKEFIGKTKYLKNKICINYNRWVQDKDYRKALAKDLDLQFTDAGFSEVPNVGGGSSFDGTSRNNNANQMKVMDRWQYFADDEEFLILFRNRQLVSYYKKIFKEDLLVQEYIENKLKKRFSNRATTKTFLHTSLYPLLLEYKLKQRNKNILNR